MSKKRTVTKNKTSKNPVEDLILEIGFKEEHVKPVEFVVLSFILWLVIGIVIEGLAA
ncbi:hypothetical protein [Methanolobus sp. WCC4]|uniref:hypothetical protein n=1 Tax=Methanolobus sp. WCC4 TaxID=3125784 RepID=UPI0030FCD4E9